MSQKNGIRILQVLGTLDIGGAESMIMNLYRKIDKNIIQFDFIIHTDEDGYFGDEVETRGGNVFKAPHYTGMNHLQYIKWWNDFFIHHKEYQILHCHIRSTASIIIPIAKNHGLKTIVHSHSTSNGSGIKAKLKNLMQLPIRYQADYFFACSREAGEWLYGKRVCESIRYYFIPNSIDIYRFLFEPEIRGEIRKELHLEGKKVIGNIGRVEEPKNQSFLLDILYEMVKTDDSVRLLLVGDGKLLEPLKEKAHNLKLDEFVIFTGARNDVERIYQAMDVFVFPSVWEGLPVSVVEAQASGLLCLVSNRITADVKLTKRIRYISLERGARAWAEVVRKSLEYRRSGVGNDDLESLKKFESNNVAKQLQNFYLTVRKKAITNNRESQKA